MKQIIQTLNANPYYGRIIEWGKLISIAGSAQVLIQAISLISGILVIRILPTHEYGLYTLANTMLGTMIVLADGGISTGVISQGSKVWQDKNQLGSVLATGLDLRKKFAVGSLIIAIPVLLYLLQHHNASWLMSGMIIASLIIAFLTSLSNNIFQIAPKLHQDILPLQKNQVETNLARLILLLATIFIFPWAFVAILSTGLPQFWTNLRLKKISNKYAEWSEKPSPAVQKEILTVVKRALPDAIYYCLSGQITIWLISIFGSTKAVAQIGALGRLAMVLNLFNILFVTLILPRFVRMEVNASVILKRYIQIQAGLLVLILGIISFTWLFPAEVLWILGKDYSDLKQELVLSIIGSCLSLIAGLSFHLSSSKGWVINPLLSIFINITSIIIGLTVIDISTLNGVLTFNILIAGSQLVMHVLYGLIKIMRLLKIPHEGIGISKNP